MLTSLYRLSSLTKLKLSNINIDLAFLDRVQLRPSLGVRSLTLNDISFLDDDDDDQTVVDKIRVIIAFLFPNLKKLTLDFIKTVRACATLTNTIVKVCYT